MAGLAADLAALPSFQWCIADIIGPATLRLAHQIAGRRLSQAGAPFRFAPHDVRKFFSALGWQTTDLRSSWLAQRRLRRATLAMRALWSASPPRLRAFYQSMAQFVLLHRT